MAFSQVNKLRATEFAMRFISENSGWTDWTDWSNCNVLIVFDKTKDRITIYSNETQEYDIITSHDGYYDSVGDYVWLLEAIDKNGMKCKLRVVTRKLSDRVELYVNHSDNQWVYNVHFID
jgi:peptidoglycan/xylan/chitin deacetylase (PgdA/CDA1 family)